MMSDIRAMIQKINQLEMDLERSESRLAKAENKVKILLKAICEAAVPLEGLTLAANMTESDLGLSESSWHEINNGVQYIRQSLLAVTKIGE